MKDDSLYRTLHEEFVGRQVKLDAREPPRVRRDWPTIAELALARYRAARVLEEIEVLQVLRDLDSSPLVEPMTDFAENSA